MLSRNFHCEKNNHSAFLILQKICKKITKRTISDIFQAFKTKLQIIHLDFYIHCFFQDLTNVSFYFWYHTSISVSIIILFYVLILTFLFFLISPRDSFYNLQCLMISLRPTPYITEIKKNTFNNQNKYSNMIILGTRYKLFLFNYQIIFFLPRQHETSQGRPLKVL